MWEVSLSLPENWQSQDDFLQVKESLKELSNERRSTGTVARSGTYWSMKDFTNEKESLRRWLD